MNFNIKFTSLASGSTGNCYLISGYETKILLECGIPISKISEKLNHKIHDIDSCFVTHKHKDHAKSVFEIAAKGVDVYALKETLEDFPKHHRFNALKYKMVESGRSYAPVKVGNEFTVYPFPVEHDCENCGFLIHSHLSGEKLLFVIDTYFCEFKFTGITHFCVECNYSIEILNDRVKENGIAPVYADRIHSSHFSLESLCDFFKANDLSVCKEINLLHMSTGNGNAKLFKSTIEVVTGKKVNVCAVDGGYYND
jgi:phosphoribosyl 1,2-cyclic phosphodiesterase